MTYCFDYVMCWLEWVRLEESLGTITEGPSRRGVEAAHRLMAASLGPCNTKEQNLSKCLHGKFKMLFLPAPFSLIVPWDILELAIPAWRIFPIFVEFQR